MVLAAGGVSPLRLVTAPVWIGVAAALLAVTVSVLVAPVASKALNSSLVELSKHYMANRLTPKTFFAEITGVVLYPKEAAQEKNTFNGFLMYEERKDKVGHILVAKRAKVGTGKERNLLQLSFEDGQIHRSYIKDDVYTLGGFEKASITLDIGHQASRGLSLLSAVEGKTFQELNNDMTNLKLSRRNRNVAATAWHRRFSQPLASLLFALLACSLGVTGRLRGQKKTLLTSVLLVAAFYLLMRTGDVLVDKGFLLPVGAAWLPNILVAAIVFLRMGRQLRRP